MYTLDDSHSVVLDGILDAAPGLELHELQIAYRAMEADLLARFDTRKSVCNHVDTERGYVEIRRPPNHSFGCLHCLTTLKEEA